MNPPPATPSAAAESIATATYPVMGVPVHFASNSPAVMAMAEDAFGGWRILRERSGWIGPVRAEVRIIVVPGADPPAGEPAHSVPHHHLLLLSGGGCAGEADADRRRAEATVTAAALDDAPAFRVAVVEALALFLVTRIGRMPLHAAAVERDGAALLIAGPSGAGKSTTVYAAARSGLRVLSEDAVFLQADPFRVWGMPGTINLRPQAAAFFPELERIAPVRLPNGRVKLPAVLRGTEAAAQWPAVERAGVCLLARGGVPGVERISAGELAAALTETMEPGFEHFRGRIDARLRPLVECGGWRLRLPPRPADAVPLIHAMFDEMERRTAG